MTVTRPLHALIMPHAIFGGMVVASCLVIGQRLPTGSAILATAADTNVEKIALPSPIPEGYVVVQYYQTPIPGVLGPGPNTSALIKKPAKEEKIELPSPIPKGYVIVTRFQQGLPNLPGADPNTHALIRKVK